jgi:hypothetical protein
MTHEPNIDSFRTVLEVIHGSFIGPSSHSELIQNIAGDNTNDVTHEMNPAMAGIARCFACQ